MLWGLKRFYHSGQSHFVTFCCYHRRRLFSVDASCRTFESALERVRRISGLNVYGYVVMPEHVHVLLSEPHRDGGPLKPGFGLSGAVRQPDTVSPLLVRVFVPSILTQSRPIPHSRSRSGENCSIASPPGVRITRASPDSDECSATSLQTAHNYEC